MYNALGSESLSFATQPGKPTTSREATVCRTSVRSSVEPVLAFSLFLKAAICLASFQTKSNEQASKQLAVNTIRMYLVRT